jgi:hypothetical protein
VWLERRLLQRRLALAGHRPGAIDYQMPSPVAALQVPAVGAGVYYVRVVAVGPAGLTPLTPEIVVVVPGTPPPAPARPRAGIG